MVVTGDGEGGTEMPEGSRVRRRGIGGQRRELAAVAREGEG